MSLPATAIRIADSTPPDLSASARATQGWPDLRSHLSHRSTFWEEDGSTFPARGEVRSPSRFRWRCTHSFNAAPCPLPLGRWRALASA